MDKYAELANAIIVQASHDYCNATLNNNLKSLEELNRFFHGKLYRAYTTLDADILLEKLNAKCKRFLKLSDAIPVSFISKKSLPEYKAFNCPFCGEPVYVRKTKGRKITRCEKCNIQIG